MRQDTDDLGIKKWAKVLTIDAASKDFKLNGGIQREIKLYVNKLLGELNFFLEEQDLDKYSFMKDLNCEGKLKVLASHYLNSAGMTRVKEKKVYYCRIKRHYLLAWMEDSVTNCLLTSNISYANILLYDISLSDI